MRFKIDENLHPSVAELLTSRNHDVHTVYDEGLRGCEDIHLAEHCHKENRVLITLDLDFSDIRQFPPAAHAGFIVLRLADQSRLHVLKIMTRILDLISCEPVAGRLWIVSEGGIRIRGE
jgi:predicted nuclease of predicted toxin-antitoxin system